MRTFFAIFAISLLLISCQQYENEFIDNNKNEIIIINKELKTLNNFNDSILQLSPQTRGFWGRLLSTVSADIIGVKAGFEASVGVAAYVTAASGGTAGPITGVAVLTTSGLIGAGMSYGAYKGCTLSCVPDERFYDTSLNIMMSNNKVIGLNVIRFKEKIKERNITEIDISSRILGEETCLITADLHGDIVNATLESEAHPLTRNDLNTYVPLEPQLNVSSYEIPLFTDSEIMNMSITTNDVLKNYFNTNNYEYTLSEMIHKNLISNESGSILKLFLDALQGFNGEEHFLDIIIKRYNKVVSESDNISIIDKNSLLISFATAKNSISLWKERIIE